MKPKSMIEDFQTLKKYVDVEIEGLPFIAKEIEITGVRGLYDHEEMKVEGLGTVHVRTIPKSREFRITIEGGAYTKELYNYLKNLAQPTLTLKVLGVDDEVKVVVKDIKIKYDHDETAYFVDEANDLYSYSNVELELVETFDPPSDFNVEDKPGAGEQVKPKDANATTPPVSSKPSESITIKAKPSCAFCMKLEGYKYVYYEATFENKCKHCNGKLTVETTRRVPESQLHCTKCGANYCGVCGRKKVWNKKRADKYRLKVVTPAKKA